MNTSNRQEIYTYKYNEYEKYVNQRKYQKKKQRYRNMD